jgi:hypothetical protein
MKFFRVEGESLLLSACHSLKCHSFTQNLFAVCPDLNEVHTEINGTIYSHTNASKSLYKNLYYCRYNVQAPPDHFIVVTFDFFNVTAGDCMLLQMGESAEDLVTTSFGCSLNSSAMTGKSMSIATDTLQLMFLTNANGTDFGFVAKYQIVTDGASCTFHFNFELNFRLSQTFV